MILIVGSNRPYTAEFSTLNNLGLSILFTGQELSEGVYHTSLADCKNLQHHLAQFEKIYWAKSRREEFDSFTDYFETLYLLKNCKHVIGLNDDPYNLRERIEVKNSEDNCVFLGCSHTMGGFCGDPSNEYYNIVSNHFNLTPLNLALSGRGNFRSYDHFQKIKFYKNQIVVLQLTDFARLRYYPSDIPECKLHEKQLYFINNKSYLDVFNDKQLIYLNLSRLESVIRLSREIGLRFVFFYLGDVPSFDGSIENDRYKKTVEYYLTDYQEYIPNILEKNVDRGTDNVHYGPLSHKIWANEIINKIHTLYS